MGTMAELDMLRRAAQPAAAPARRGRPTGRVWVSFWWPDYEPQQALDPLRTDGDEVRLTGKSVDGGRTWVAACATLETVREWMLARGYRVLDCKLIGQRRWAGRWEGLYALEIGG